jgi:hypothetical protein
MSSSMNSVRHVPLVCVLASFLMACAPVPMFRQNALAPVTTGELKDKAVVVVAADLRELTSLRDMSQVGDVCFRKVDGQYSSRAPNDFDFGIHGSVAADWRANFGSKDDNKAPQIFVIEPGTYVLEHIKIGANAVTAGPGYVPAGYRFGGFSVRAGEVVNLGELVIHLRWRSGVFTAETIDNSVAVRELLATRDPGLEAKLETKLLPIAPSMPFRMGGGF